MNEVEIIIEVICFGGLIVAVSICSIHWNRLNYCKGMTSDIYRLVAGLDDINIDPLLKNLERHSAVLEQNFVEGSDVYSFT